jgi:hypothetical protein
MYIDPMKMARARLALRTAIRDHLFDPNVSLIDFGHPEHDGAIAMDELAIRIHVKQKLFDGALESAVESGYTRWIPPWIDGFPTDVPQGTYRPRLWFWWNNGRRPPTDPRRRHADPLRGGISISDEYHAAAGTLGGKVIDRVTGKTMLLSNWHVLVADWGARTGQRIYQPGRLDGGVAVDTVATLTRDAMAVNFDAAVATLNGARQLINDQLDLGPVTGVGRAELGLVLEKSGCMSGVTHGIVTAVEGTAKIRYGFLDRLIRNVVTIEPRGFGQVSTQGDSGSWWLDEATKQAIGLHFAGSDFPERGLAIDMQSVLDALNVDIATDREAATSLRAGRMPGRRPAFRRDGTVSGVAMSASHSGIETIAELVQR